jgi:2-polyprenyl-3-methyl-5-hydroxy-6-metoxy-1,4-benzoquinol methylase
MKTLNKIEQQREHFENISNKYYTARQAKNHLRLKFLLWNEFLRKKDYLRKNNLIILEPMCGYGEGKKIVEEHLGIQFEYEGFDYSDTLIQTVKTKNPELNVYTQDVTKFEATKKYDVIIVIGGLHHVPDYTLDVMNNLSDALNEEGYFINFEPTQNNFILKWVRNRIYKKNSLFDNETERAYDLKDLNQFYSTANLEVVDQIYPGLVSYILYYNPDAFPLLNFGGRRMVDVIFKIDRLFFRNILGRFFSFATLTIMKKKK